MIDRLLKRWRRKHVEVAPTVRPLTARVARAPAVVRDGGHKAHLAKLRARRRAHTKRVRKQKARQRRG